MASLFFLIAVDPEVASNG